MNWLKLLLIAVVLLLNVQSYVERIQDINTIVTLASYLLLFAASVSVIVAAAMTRVFVLRLILGLLLGVAFVFENTYHEIAAEVLTYNTFLTLFNSRGFAGEALDEYFYLVLESIFWGGVLLLAVLLPVSGRAKVNKWLLIPVPFVIIAVMTVLMFMRGGEGARGLPYFIKPVVFLNLALYETVTTDYGDRNPVSIQSSGGVQHDIIVIMDESILGTFLDINSDSGVASGLKTAPQHARVTNFGLAAAATNCSYGSNIVVRYGGTRSHYDQYIASMPSIWAYANQAGYNSVFIDAQRDGGKYQNGMTDEERAEIKDFVQFDDVAVVDRDMQIADKIVSYINNGQRDFIYVNKIGAHFPVNDRYPDDYLKYSPALSRGNNTDITDKPSREGYSASDEHWERYRNSYRNTITWNVGQFFEKIWQQASLDQATILYTADHGQDLHEHSHTALSTHCNPNPVDEEGVVPLVIIEGSGIKSLDWHKHLAENVNQSSHYNIFPTVLKLMGFDQQAVESTYGRSLDMPTVDDYTFNTRFFARLGKKPVWKKIDLDNLQGTNPTATEHSETNHASQ